jgi:cation diffusion facilitator CzcD-associated flavoprotein CzcO
VDYPGAEHFRGKRVLVVGGGASAVQFLGELAPVTETIWVTRRPPVWRTEGFDQEAGRQAVALVEERVRRGLPPASVVSVTGLGLREQERLAESLGAYRRRPMFVRIEPDGVRWADGTFERVDAILWATGFRPAVRHLAPLDLRSPYGGIQLERNGTTAAADPRVQLVGYGPSASTIGANRAGRAAAIAVSRHPTAVAA